MSLSQAYLRPIDTESPNIVELTTQYDAIWQDGDYHVWQDGGGHSWHPPGSLPDVGDGGEGEPSEQDVVLWPDFSDMLWPDGSPVQWPNESNYLSYQISVDLDGDGDFIDIGNDQSLHVYNGSTLEPFTICAWIKPRNLKPFRVFSRGDSSMDRELLFGFGPDGELAFWIWGAANHIAKKTANDLFTGVREDTWIFVAATYDGTTDASGISLYVDGLLVESNEYESQPFTVPRDSQPGTWLGRYAGASYADGQIGEVKIFRQALTTGDIGRLWLNLGNSPTPDVAWYAIQELQGTVVVDGVGGNDGTLYGDASWVDEREEIVVPGPGEVYVDVDGVDDQVIFPLSVTWDLDATPMTVCFWMRMTTTNQSLLAKDGEFDLRIGASGNLEGYIYTDESNYIYGDTGNLLIPQGEWVHLCMSWQGDDEQSMRFYINGQLRQENRTEFGTFTGVTVNPANAVQTAFQGSIDGLQIYARQITDQEVLNLYNRATNAPTPEVSDYRFDRGYGVAVGDYVNGYTAALDGAVWQSNQVNLLRHVVDFDGVDDYVSLGTGLNFGDGVDDEPFTIAVWLKRDEAGVFRLLSKASDVDSDLRHIWYTINSDDQAMLWLSSDNDSTVRIARKSDNVIPVGEWVHLVVTYDASKTWGGIKFYINGVDSHGGSTNSNPELYVAMAPSAFEANIGQWMNDGFTPGQIGSFQVFNRVITEEEIDKLYRVAIDRPTPDWVDIDFDGTGLTVANSGSESNGTLVGAVRYDTTVPDDRTRRFLDFDGVDDYVDLGTGYNFGDGSTDQPFSMSAWIYADTDQDAFRIVNKSAANGSTASYRWSVNNSGYLFLSVFDEVSTTYIGRVATVKFNADEWVHVAATYDGSATEEGIKLYINGEEVAVSEWSNNAGSYVAMHASVDPVWLGRVDDTHVTKYKAGRVAELKIFDKELTAYEVSKEYRRASDAEVPAVAEYLINETSGTTLPATVGDDGTIYGALWANEVFASETDLISLSLNGESDGSYVDLGSSDAFGVGNGISNKPMTIAGWVAPNDFAGFRIAYRGVIEDEASTEYLFGFNNSNSRLAFFLYDSDGDRIAKVVGADSEVHGGREGEWIHVAVTYDGSSSSDGITLYIDGFVADQNNSPEGTYDAGGEFSANAYLGRYVNTSSIMFADGKIGEMMFFNTELTPQQVGMLFAGLDESPTPTIAHYPIQEGQGGKLRDIINRNDGLLLDEPQWINEGAPPLEDDIVEHSLLFDGVNDYVDLGDYGRDELNFGDGASDFPFTISFWIRDESLQNTRILSKTDTTSDRDLIVYAGGGRFIAYLSDGTLDNRIQVNGEYVTDRIGEWMHVTLTYDGSGVNTGLKLYVDGEDNVASHSVNGTYIAMHTSTNPFHIGRSGSVYETMELADLKIWSTELNASQVAQVYAGSGPTPDLLHLPINEGSGKGLKDLVSGHTAQIIGATWNNYDPTARSLYFPGDDSIALAGDLLFGAGTDTDEPVSIEAWIRVERTDGFRVFHVGEIGVDDGSWSILLGLDGDSRPSFFCYQGGANVYDNRLQVKGDVFNRDQEWIHIAATYDGSKTPEGVSVYIDGAEIAYYERVKNGTYDGYGEDVTGAVIGELTGGGSSIRYSLGQIGDLRVYDRKLTSSEIADHYNQVRRADPIALYRFEDRHGTTLADARGNHDGSFTSLGWRGVDDLDVRALSLDFDGVDDEVDLGTSIKFGNTTDDDPFSLTAWINPRESLSFLIFTQQDPGNNATRRMLFSVDANENLAIRLYDGGNVTYIGQISSDTIPEDEWTHVAATYDGSSAVGGIKLYINGAVAAINPTTNSSYTAMHDGTFRSSIGEWNAEKYADGKITDFRIYGSELTATEVRQIANQDVNAPVPDVAHYTMEGSYGSTLVDEVGSADGTIDGATWARDIEGAVFDGEDDWLDASTPDNSGAMIVEAVIKVSGATRASSEGIIGKYAPTGDNRSYLLFIESDNKVKFNVSSDGSVISSSVVSATTLTPGQWYRIRAEYSPSTHVRLYIDGALETEDTTSIPASLYANGDVDLTVGSFGSHNSLRSFNGQIAYAGIDGHAAYLFGRNHGSTVPDISGNGNDLTYRGSGQAAFYAQALKRR